MRALLAAWDEAERAVAGAGNRRDDVLALLGRQPDTDGEIAAQMYATLLDPAHGLCAGGEVEPAAFEAVLRLRAEPGRLRGRRTTSPRSRAPGGGLVR